MDGESVSVSVTSTGACQQDFRLRKGQSSRAWSWVKPAGFKQLVGTARDQVINLLRRLDKWLAKGEARRRRLTRSYGRRTPSVCCGMIDRRLCWGEPLARFRADRLVVVWPPRDLGADRLVSSGRSQKQSIETNVVDLSGMPWLCSAISAKASGAKSGPREYPATLSDTRCNRLSRRRSRVLGGLDGDALPQL